MATKRRPQFKTKWKFNESLYDGIWNHIFGGPLAKHKASDILHHYGAAIRSFEENLPDLMVQEGWSKARVRREIAAHYKAERVLSSAATQLKRLGF